MQASNTFNKLILSNVESLNKNILGKTFSCQPEDNINITMEFIHTHHLNYIININDDRYKDINEISHMKLFNIFHDSSLCKFYVISKIDRKNDIMYCIIVFNIGSDNNEIVFIDLKTFDFTKQNNSYDYNIESYVDNNKIKIKFDKNYFSFDPINLILENNKYKWNYILLSFVGGSIIAHLAKFLIIDL